MRGLFTIAALLVALAVVALLARKQVAPQAPPGATDVAPAATSPKRIEDDFRRALDTAQQQRPPVPEEAR